MRMYLTLAAIAVLGAACGGDPDSSSGDSTSSSAGSTTSTGAGGEGASSTGGSATGGSGAGGDATGPGGAGGSSSTGGSGGTGGSSSTGGSGGTGGSASTGAGGAGGSSSSGGAGGTGGVGGMGGMGGTGGTGGMGQGGGGQGGGPTYQGPPPSTWTAMTSPTNLHLWFVWGTSMSDIWAVGSGGTAVHYNGSYWVVVPTGTTHGLGCVHGTASNNVFATTALGAVYKFDGAGWSLFSDLSANNGACSWVAGSDDLFVSVYNHPSNSLFRVTPPAANGHLNTFSTGLFGSARMGGTSASNVWVAGGNTMRYDGTTVTDEGYATDVYVFDGNTAYLTQGGSTFQKWTGPGTTQLINTGQSDDFVTVTGTDVDRVFLTGGSSTFNTGAIVFYDGFGVVPMSLPANTKFLRDSWAAPTGEVISVGNNGTIVLGQ